MRKIICTTGTSIARGIKYEGDCEGYKRFIRERVSREKEEHPLTWLKIVSGETNSLNALELSKGDDVYFLYTDTEDGAICAECVSEIVEESFGVKAFLKRIAGLQVKEAVQFRREGINSLFAALKELTEPYEYDDSVRVLLNVTGGFKSVVPFVTIYGLLRRLEVVYLFEFSSSLIYLPPIPVQFDFERLGQAAEALRVIQREGVMKREEFYSCIPGLPYEERAWYNCLLESDAVSDDMVTLSAIAEQLLVAREEDRCQVLLGPSAQKSYDKSAGVARWQFDFMLKQVGDPLWRQQHRHAISGNTDLECYKPGSTAQRLSGFLRGHTFYVCELHANHDRYEREVGGLMRADYDLSKFIQWVEPTTNPVPETEADQVRQYEKRLKTLKKENDEVNQGWQEAQEQADSAIEKLSKIEAEKKEVVEAVQTLKKENRELSEAFAKREHEIERLKSRTLFQRLFNR